MAITAARIHWDGQGEKKYEAGVSQGVLYKYDSTDQKWYGVAWNGLTSVTESPDGAEKTDLFADNIKYASMRSAETFGGTIEAYTYPPEFAGCNGEKSIGAGVTIGQQPREAFCLCYRTEQGNDQDPNLGYKLHLVYNCTCSPSERAYETINDSPDAITMSWEFDSTPVPSEGNKSTSIVVIDSTAFTGTGMPAKLKLIEDALYGVTADSTANPAIVGAKPYMLMPDAIKYIMDNGQYPA